MSDERRAILRAKVIQSAGEDIRDPDKADRAAELAAMFFDEMMETLDHFARIADALEGIERQMGGIPGMRR